MAPKRLPHTFPHKIVFATALLLCLCAGTTVAFAALAWSRLLWGYYWWTGFWSGAVILLVGIFGIVCSFVRNTSSVKTFMIIAIFGSLVSLGMIALSVGGLNTDSGFYNGGNSSHFLSFIYHSICLGTGILQLALCVLSDGICVYYLFYEKSAELYKVKDAKKKKNNIVRNSSNKNRSSTASQAPLLHSSSSNADKHKRKDKKKKGKSKNGRSSVNADNIDFQDDMPIAYTSTSRPLSAKLLRKQDQQTSPRNTCSRSASFSTFGHKDGPDRVSLIVHSPDDNQSVANTTRTHTPDPQRNSSECHYAQTLLFDSPLPIEEDDELPPYEVVDTHTYTNIEGRKQKRSKSNKVGKESGKAPVKRSKSVPSRNKNATGATQRQRPSSSRLENLRFESDTELKQIHSDSGPVLRRHFHSTELLDRDMYTNAQGVIHRDFAHSSDRILMRDVQMRHPRPQSAKVVRDKRSDRRRRAVSCEVKLSRDQIMAHGSQPHQRLGYRSRTNSMDGSNASLFASNRILPTKFSLRTPMRKVGMPHVCSPVPVKPLKTSSLKLRPPPKPPRTHSVTLADLKADEEEVIYADTADDVFASAPVPVKRTNVPKRDTEHPREPRVKSQTIDISALIGTNVIHLNDAKLENQKKVVYTKPIKIPVKMVEKGNAKETVDNVKPVEPPTPGKIVKPVKQVYIKPINKPARAFEKERPKVIEKKEIPNNVVVLNAVKPASVQLATIDSGPVVKCAPPKSIVNSRSVTPKESVVNSMEATMLIPTSPIMKQPPKTPESKTVEQGNTVSLHSAKQTAHTYDDMNVTAKTSEQQQSDLKDVVYAKINEEVQETPEKVVRKSQKLLFSFSDKNQINVFDPSPVREKQTFLSNEVVADIVESVSVKHTVETKKPQVERNVESNSIPDLKPVIVSPIIKDPLSPTDRVLERKNLTSSISLGHDELRNTNNPLHHDGKRSSSLYGARPKTTMNNVPLATTKPGVTHRNNDSKESYVAPTSFHHSSRPFASVNASPAVSPPISNLPSPSKRPIPPVRRIVNEPSQSATSINNDTNMPHTNSYSARATPSPTVSASVHNTTRDRSPTAATRSPSHVPAMSSNSQGIRHMPQSQHSRQMAPHGAHAQGGPGQAVVVNAQSVQEVNNNDDPSKPLFSVVL